MGPAPTRVLLVDDDDTFHFILKDLLSPARYSLDRVAGYAAALEAMAAGTHDVYLVDYRLPGHSGLDLVREASARGYAAPMLVLTGVGDREVDLEAMKAGAADYLDKGRIDEVTLERAIRHAIERKRAADSLRQLKKAVDTLQIGLTITDVAGRIVYTNPAEAALHGFTVEEMLRSEGRALSPREDWQPPSVEQVREFLEVDTLAYLSLEGMLSCAKNQPASYCTACWSGRYKIPIDSPQSKLSFEREQLKMF